MIKNYFQTALRKLGRNRSYTAINVFGLTMGITCALLIFILVRFELRFDTFHSKGDRIYRLITVANRQEGVRKDYASQFPLGETLRLQMPRIEKTTSIGYFEEALVSINRPGESPARFRETAGFTYVEPEFFEMFDFPWVAGSPSSLRTPFKIALSESIAKKYFGTTDVIGKTLRVDNQYDFEITGIVQDFPTTTDFPFTMMASWETVKKMEQNQVTSWHNSMTFLNTFVLLDAAFPPEQFQAQLPDFIKRNMEPRLAAERSYELQPLSDVHFNTEYGNYNQRVAGYESLWALAVIGVFLIITACINFINLATAQAMNRSKEVGVRKVLGAERGQIVYQFLGEALLITLVALVVSLGCVELLLPKVGGFLRIPLAFELSEPAMAGFLVLLVCLVAFGSGYYPALVLSHFHPAVALKGQAPANRGGGFFLRKGLVMLQFVISQVLIIGTLVVIYQMRYFQSRDLGFNKEAIVVVPLPTNEKTKLESLRHEIGQHAAVRDLSFTFSSASSGNVWATMIRYPKGADMLEIRTDVKVADERYVPMYGFKMLAGRNYIAGDTVREFVVNETLMRRLGYQNPGDILGQTVLFGRRNMPIPVVGVVADFNTGSLHQPIHPTILGTRIGSYQEANVKIDMSRVNDALAHIEKAWSKVYPDFIYDYRFLDERIANFYEEEARIMTMFEIFAGISILIGCLGLLGLVSFLAERKTKEIGVRKVLGAGITDILGMFGLEFFKLIVLAFLVAGPMAYYFMNHWLENFAFRIDIGPLMFVTAIGVSMAIAAVTIAYRVVRAATANPVDALKYE